MNRDKSMTKAAMRAPLMEHDFEEAGVESTSYTQASPFILAGSDETYVGHGVGQIVPPAIAEQLAQTVSAFWNAQPTARFITGMLPFERTKPAHLFAPMRIENALPHSETSAKIGDWTSVAEPTPDTYAQAVTRALALLDGGGDLQKVVLARSLLMKAPGLIDLRSVLARLTRDPSVTAYAVPLLPLNNGVPRTLMGATPELLVDKRGLDVRSQPLAGSARRHPDRDADENAARGLMNSQKDLLEHGFVVEAILDTLAPFCKTLTAPKGPALIATASMWHLGTSITGQLKDDAVSVIELAAALHPTPAVCGLPRAAASEAIDALEEFDRGFYAGAVGWANRKGDGRWMVAIRCAEIMGDTARLYAGAGIVPGSDPWAEVAETSAKFAALLAALGIDEAGRPQLSHVSNKRMQA